MRFYSIIIIAALFFLSCKKNTIMPPEEMPPLNGVPASDASLKLNISHVVNGSALVLDPSYTYTTASNDTFSVRLFRYYFSNVTLTNDAGQTISVPGSYYLVDESYPSTKAITLQNIPEGDYTTVSFLIGVDSLKNVSGAQSGVLDPVNGMFWDWISGYIMAKMEGYSPQSGSNIKDLSFHIGGFNGANRGIRNISLSLPMNAHVHKEHQSQVNISGDLAKWFSGTNTITFSNTYFIGNISSRSKSIADNYAHMFTVTSVIN